MAATSLSRVDVVRRVFSTLYKFHHPEKNIYVKDNGRCLAHSSSIHDRDSWVVMTDDGSTIVCWHPEIPFPYEHTKPLPEIEPELREGDSVLKVQYRLDDKHRYRPDGPTMEELQKITYTTKHRWYPKPEKKYKKPNPPRDREGI